MADRFKSQPISFPAPEVSPSEPTIEQAFSSLAQSKSTANVLDRDEDGKLPIQIKHTIDFIIQVFFVRLIFDINLF